MIVGGEVPGVAAFAVVFAHRAPLALGEIRAPLPPRHPLLPRLREPLPLSAGPFSGHGCHLAAATARPGCSAPRSEVRETATTRTPRDCPLGGAVREHGCAPGLPGSPGPFTSGTGHRSKALPTIRRPHGVEARAEGVPR